MMPMSRRGPLTSAPPTVIRPEVGSMSPPISFNRVDLPQPLGPTKDTNCPAEMAKLTSRNASTATVPRRVRNTFRTFSISIASAHAPARLRLGRDSVPGMNSPGYLCVVGAGIVICYLFPLCAVDCGVRKDELRHSQHAIDPPWFAWTRPTHRAVARGKKFVLAAQP